MSYISEYLNKLLRSLQYFTERQRHSLSFFIIILLVIVLISVSIRYKQALEVRKHPEAFFVNNTPMMTTLDAYLWLRYAKELKTGNYKGNDNLRFYPFGTERLTPAPLLSVMIAKLSYFFDGNLHKTGAYMVLLLSSLFLIPFCVFFYKIGYPSCGIVGGLTGSLNLIYLARTSIGRVDTDALNLFFPFLICLFIMLCALAKTKGKTFLYSALAGITVFGFSWWYFKKEFISIYCLFLAITLIWHKKDALTVFLACMFYTITTALPYSIMFENTTAKFILYCCLILTCIYLLLYKLYKNKTT
ncbi:MAG: hypothetical protein L3V56_08875, partial [Candidatus Magnetoovum sp. WYHC-5]|nr:hypothetical protein [Candidatus Magnetoovum sp. WYHC-5]